ncbi:MAG: tetratricopeptide repeat protein [Chthoniobacterales bacterium]
MQHLEEARNSAAQDETIKNASPSLSRKELCQQLLKSAYQLTISGSYRNAQSLNDLVLRLAQASGDADAAAAAQVQNAYLFREEGDLAAALQAVGKALDHYESHPGTKHGLISAYQTQGLCYIAQSDFARALECYHHALNLSQEIKPARRPRC